MLLALGPAILCAYTALTVQDFHEKLQNGFFAVVVDVYAACLPQAQPTTRPPAANYIDLITQAMGVRVGERTHP
jgi:hypothetical protein